MAGFLFPWSLLTLPPRDSILIQAGITNFRHRALVSDRILTARYILLQSGFASRALLLQLPYLPSLPFSYFIHSLFPLFFLPFLRVPPFSFFIYFLAFGQKTDEIRMYCGLLTLGRAWPRGFSCQGTVDGWNCSFPHEPLSNGFSPMCPCKRNVRLASVLF